jgi:hypothetical protein
LLNSKENPKMSRKLRMGMIGGGRGAFIGAVHRMAAGIDGQIELVCGALHVDPEKQSFPVRTSISIPAVPIALIMKCLKKKASFPRRNVWIL